MRKATVTPISLILIVFIVLVMIALAYIWGIPMIEKRTSMVNYESAENFMLRMDQAITNVVSAGGGQEEISIPFGKLSVIPHDAVPENANNNSIMLEFSLPQPLAIDRSVIYLGSVSFADQDKETGIYGQSDPGVMNLTTQKEGDEYLYTINLHYRTLETFTAPVKGYKIAVRSSKPTGFSSVMVSYGSTDMVEGQSPSGGNLTRTFVDINVY